jgi:dephospho-CoA kinase
VLVVGLTGGIGVGKTTVARMLARHGAVVIDCDRLGRTVVEPGGRAHAAVLARFGEGIRRDDSSIDRPALARLVFGDARALADLNAITHPAIDAEIAAAVATAAPDAIVVLDMAVLVETDLGAGQYDLVAVVEAPLEVRLARLDRRGMTRDEALARIANQASDAQRRAKGALFLENSGTEADLEVAVGVLWRELQRRS